METQRILTVTDTKCEVVIFLHPDGSAEAIISHNSSPFTPTKYEIPKAPTGQRIVVMRYRDGSVDVLHKDIES